MKRPQSSYITLPHYSSNRFQLVCSRCLSLDWTTAAGCPHCKGHPHGEYFTEEELVATRKAKQARKRRRR